MPALSEMDLAIAGSPVKVRVRHAVQAIRTLAELDRIASGWERLAAGRNPVSDFAYARAWAAGLDGTQRLHVLTAGNADDLAIAPLVINRGGAGWLTLLASEMYEILDFLGADEAAVSELARAIVQTGRPLYLKRVPADAPVVAALEAAYRGRGFVRRRIALDSAGRILGRARDAAGGWPPLGSAARHAPGGEDGRSRNRNRHSHA